MTTKYNNREEITRRQYDMLSRCLYTCKGKYKTQECDNYAPDKNKDCAWYQVVQHDLKKIEKRDKCLTFPLLERILERNKEK